MSAKIKTVKRIASLAWLALYGSIALSEGICIPEAIQSAVAEGTVYFGSQKHPLPDVRVEIVGHAYGAPVLASSTTDKDGRFCVSGMKAGWYRLNAKHATVGHLEVELRVRSSLFWHRKRRIVIVIGNDPSKGPCWGGYARTVGRLK